MASKLIIETEAIIEIEEAINWYESKQKGLGNDFYNYLDGYFQTLKYNKSHFAVKRKPVYRELPLKRFPYVIIYEMYQDTIIVYSIFNTQQNPKKKNK